MPNPLTSGNWPPLPDIAAQAVRESVLYDLAADPERYLSDYSNRFGNVLNADNAATLFEPYNRDRARFRVAVNPAATWLRDELFRRALANQPAFGKRSIVFTAGGNAAGKSTALEFAGTGRDALAVFDSTLSNPVYALDLIHRTLAARKTVILLYVDRPLDDALMGMLERARHQGRVVSIDQLIRSHRGAAETIRLLWNEFRDDDRCAFRFIANSSAGASEGSIERAQPRDYTQMKNYLYELLESEYRAGRITCATFDRVGNRGQ
jgi:hypothetical protein